MGIKFEKISARDSWRIFDRAAHRLLNVDGETFARRWDQGEYAPADSAAVKVAMLRPSGR